MKRWRLQDDALPLLPPRASLSSVRAFSQLRPQRKPPTGSRSTIPPLPAFHPQEPKRIVLPNGMVIFLQEDHELPLIDGVARIRGGSRSEPAAKTGLVDIYGEVWRTGGTKAQTGDQLDDYLEIRAAKVETNSNADSTTISWSCLKGDFDDVFKVFDDLLREPEFRADKLDLAQKEYFDAISRRNDDVDGIAGREAAKLAYGRAESLRARGRVQDGRRRHPAGSGRLAPHLRSIPTTSFWASSAISTRPRWKPNCARPTAHGPREPVAEGRKDRIQSGQARLLPGRERRRQPELDQHGRRSASGATIPTTMRFASSMKPSAAASLRACCRPFAPPKGWPTRSAAASAARFDHLGMVRLAMGTKSATTLEAIQALDEQIDDVTKHPISDAEIKRAKDSILNGFVFNLDSPDKILRERMAYEFYGYSQDYLEKFRAGVEKVTRSRRGTRGRQISAQGPAGRAGGRQPGGVRQAAVVAGPGDQRRHHDSSAPGRAGRACEVGPVSLRSSHDGVGRTLPSTSLRAGLSAALTLI